MTKREYFKMKLNLLHDMYVTDLQLLSTLNPEQPACNSENPLWTGYDIGLNQARKAFERLIQIEQITYEAHHETKHVGHTEEDIKT